MKLKLILVGLGAVSVITAVYLIWPEWFGFCEKIQTVTRGEICRAPLATTLGLPFLPFAIALFLSSVTAFPATRITFRRWSWFTLWYCVAAISLMLLAAASEIDIGFLTVALFDLEKVAWGLATIYGVISVLLLGISDFLIRRRG